MALSLNAEQKNIINIFKIQEQYIIPPYQRPYSWDYDRCSQLFNDISDAFNKSQDYFIGNVIIAKSDANRGYLEIVDGQQRLMTLLLLLKVLEVFQDDLIVLKELIARKDWKGNFNSYRIRTDVFETNDEGDLQVVLKMTLSDFETVLNYSLDKKGKLIDRKVNNKMLLNSIYFYQWIDFMVKKEISLENFTEYLLERVFLLPIELLGTTQEEANDKALVIFESINNRGMNLDDADIFKAKLYDKAKRVNESAIFMDSWSEFKGNCDSIRLEVDDVFRYYSHIIRGFEGITYSEKNLREFFIKEEFSPLILKGYGDVLKDLMRILEILEFLENESLLYSEIACWLKLVNLYSNQYPKYAIVNYLFVNGIKLDESFREFLISIVRFIYYQGSTSTIKFEIYNIIKNTTYQKQIDHYYKSEVPVDFFNNLGRLKKGFALLCFILSRKANFNFSSIERIISLSDRKFLPGDWVNVNLDNALDSLANFVVLNCSKNNNEFPKRMNYYLAKGNIELNNFVLSNYSYKSFTIRDNELKNIIISFFMG